MSNDVVTCGLCNRRFFADTILEHLLLAHDVEPKTLEVATWPDGEPAIIDATLEPDDFKNDCLFPLEDGRRCLECRHCQGLE